ncbi:unnamed protein product [Thelazia callipaeda]|uniref:Peptidase A1 domain-containing protein n=1 Tax=Thelazia callipaeda TaxID=103827 RepID=A0A0N5CMF9_THECL|nr:unnamed protein product [Thelazia callipaeda]
MTYIYLLLMILTYVKLTHSEYRIKLNEVYTELKQHVGYSLEVGIGTPEKNFSVLLQTASPLFWVADENCRFLFCKGKRRFSKSKSSTYEETSDLGGYDSEVPNKFLAISRSRDIVQIYRLIGGRLKLMNASFGMLSKFGKWVEGKKYVGIDGVLGISSTLLGDMLTENPIKQAIRTGSIEPIIAIALPPLHHRVSATLTLGGIDSELCQSDIVKSEGLFLLNGRRYEFEFSSMSWGRAKFSKPKRKLLAYPDSAEPFIMVPQQFMEAIINATNAELYSRQCLLGFNSKPGNADNKLTLGIPFLHRYCTILNPRQKTISFLSMKNDFDKEIR